MQSLLTKAFKSEYTMEIRKISSAQNEYIKMLARLSTKKNRDDAGLFLAEGEHLAEMAVTSSYCVENLLMTEEYYSNNKDKFSCDITIVPRSII